MSMRWSEKSTLDISSSEGFYKLLDFRVGREEIVHRLMPAFMVPFPRQLIAGHSHMQVNPKVCSIFRLCSDAAGQIFEITVITNPQHQFDRHRHEEK